jgi:phage terminase large subunit
MASFADEAYDVEDEVYHVATLTQTGEKSLMFLSGNAVHDSGFFYDCFNKHAEDWVRITMNTEESPIVNKQVIIDAEKKFGRHSNEFRASILGEFPIATAIDVDGYTRMFTDDWIESVMSADETEFGDDEFRVGRTFLGVDPSGEGSDEMIGYLRNAIKARIAFSKVGGSVPSCALLTIGTIELFGLDGQDVTCDNFGVGAELSQEVMIKSNGQHVIEGRNVGNKCEDTLDQNAYLNERARMYDALYWWGKRGGKILYDDVLAQELKTIFKRKNETGKLMIMPKKEMRRRGYSSPNRSDALALTTLNDRMLSNYVPRAEFRAVVTKDKKNTSTETYNKHDLVPFF